MLKKKTEPLVLERIQKEHITVLQENKFCGDNVGNT
jgi:hypothetical protein